MYKFLFSLLILIGCSSSNGRTNMVCFFNGQPLEFPNISSLKLNGPILTFNNQNGASVILINTQCAIVKIEKEEKENATQLEVY